MIAVQKKMILQIFKDISLYPEFLNALIKQVYPETFNGKVRFA